MHALAGILAALHERNRTGLGTSVEASLFDSATGLLCYMLQNYWQRGTDPQRFGIAHESLCPYEAFDTADRPLILGVANDSLWMAFCKLIERPELATDPRFATNAARVMNRQQTLAIVHEVMPTRTSAEWFKVLTEIGIPAAPLHTLSEFVQHPHARESGMIFDYEHPTFGSMHGVAQPIRLDGERPAPRRAPPMLGEHTIEVLSELGFDEETIARFSNAGTIGAHD